MNTKAKITAIGRAEAELEELLSDAVVDLEITTPLSNEVEAELRRNLEKIVGAAQDVVLARLKTRAYEVRESYRNSGADETVDADTWDAAVEAADPNGYDILWMRGWKA
jgi:hypothetical protein